MVDRKDAFVVPPALHVRGEVVVRQDVVIESNFEGTLCAPLHVVTVEAGARVMGEVDAAAVVVNGTVVGQIRAGAKIVVGPQGLVDGEVRAPSIVFAEGARVRGTINQDAAQPATVSTKAKAAKVRRSFVSDPRPAADADRATFPLSHS
ncbi:MAG: polymer-forming cytoskeletal protein [bacterium]|nr:polymer-forming cytoskeletal protein [bacterium]